MKEHFGVMEKGHMDFRVGDNKDHVKVTQGQVYYIPPGHDAVCMKDSVMVEFSVAGGGSRSSQARRISTAIPGVL